MNWIKMIEQAHTRINPLVKFTPLEYSAYFSQEVQGQVYFKQENLQHTQSFKCRGVANAILSLTATQQQKGIIVASSGNHGLGCAYVCKQLNIPAHIFVPTHASKTKIKSIKSYGAKVTLYGDDHIDTELKAQEFANNNHQTYISPYNHPAVIAGQGTIGLEILKQAEQKNITINNIYIAVGGGGLISGIAAYTKNHNKNITIIGCQPENSAIMAKSLKAGKIIHEPSLPTISDATAGGIEPDAITFDLCEKLTDRFILVSETEIKSAMKEFINQEHQSIEGSVGVALAAMLKDKEKIKNQTSIVILCGGNISEEKLETII